MLCGCCFRLELLMCRPRSDVLERFDAMGVQRRTVCPQPQPRFAASRQVQRWSECERQGNSGARVEFTAAPSSPPACSRCVLTLDECVVRLECARTGKNRKEPPKKETSGRSSRVMQNRYDTPINTI